MCKLVTSFAFLILVQQLVGQVPLNEKKGTTFMYYYQKGEEYYESKQYEQALSNYNEALTIYPYHAPSYLSRAITKEKLNDVNGALQDYTLTLELNPDQFDPLFSKALILFHQKKWELAKRDFTQLLALPNKETSSVFFKQDRFSGDIMGVVTTQGTGKSHIFNYLGLTELELNECEKAITHFDSAIYYNPEEANYYVNRGRCLESVSSYARAIDDYEKALALNPTLSIAEHNLSILKRSTGNADEAERILNEVISKNPDLPFPYAERAYHHAGQGRYTNALRDYDRAIQLAPEEAEYYVNRGAIYEKLNDWKKAYADFSVAVQLDENMERAWLSRANLLYQVGRFREAIEDYDIALFKSEDYSTAFYNRGLAKHRLGLYQEACDDLKKAAALGFEIPIKIMDKICHAK